MSVTEVKLHSAGAGGSASGTQDTGANKISYRTKYRAKVSDPRDTPKTVLAYFRSHAELPWPGRPFKFANDFDVSAICKTVDPEYVENSGGWYTVSATYESESGEDQNPGNDPDGKPVTSPFSWHDEIDVSYTQLSIPVEVAIFRQFVPANIRSRALVRGQETPVINSACVPFDPSLEEELDIKVIRISRYLRNWDGGPANQFQGAVNNDYVTIDKPAYRFRDFFAPYQGRIKQFSGTFQIINGFPCYRVTVEVHVNPLQFGWRRVVCDRGLSRRIAPGDPGGPSLGATVALGDAIDTPIRDEEGYPISEPVLLNGDGQPLRPGEKPVYLIYQTRKERPFSVIAW